jgi:Putative metallopeptidase
VVSPQSKMIDLVMAIVLIAATFADALAQPSFIKSNEPNRVSILYVAPKNPEFQQIYHLVQARVALEKVQKILSPLLLPQNLTVKTAECGVLNAFYRREESMPVVTICYELLQHIREALPKETTSIGITPDDAAISQFLWFTLHEVGHATFDIFDIPIFGREEDAADNFATYILLQNRMGEGRRLIGGVAWAWWAYLADYRKNPVRQKRLEAFANNHGLPEQRFYNLLCLAFGADPAQFGDLTESGYLPRSRAQSCMNEYARVADAFHKEISPHIDRALGQQVLDTNWLPGPVLRPEPRSAGGDSGSARSNTSE